MLSVRSIMKEVLHPVSLWGTQLISVTSFKDLHGNILELFQRTSSSIYCYPLKKAVTICFENVAGA